MIFKNNITDQEINEIVNEIRKSYGITYYSFNKIKKMQKLAIYENNILIGVLCYKENKNYIDPKFIIIKEKYRNKGHMTKLINEALTKTKKTIIFASKNPITINYLTKNGFNKLKFYKLPFKYQISQITMIFNLRRIFEYFRKRKENSNKFGFYINKQKGI